MLTQNGYYLFKSVLGIVNMCVPTYYKYDFEVRNSNFLTRINFYRTITYTGMYWY